MKETDFYVNFKNKTHGNEKTGVLVRVRPTQASNPARFCKDWNSYLQTAVPLGDEEPKDKPGDACVHVYTHVCLCACVCMPACACMYACVHCVTVYMHVSLCVRVHACMCMYVCPCALVCACLCIHMCVRACGPNRQKKQAGGEENWTQESDQQGKYPSCEQPVQATSLPSMMPQVLKENGNLSP